MHRSNLLIKQEVVATCIVTEVQYYNT